MRLFSRRLPETVDENQRGINMVDLMMWLVIAALLLAAAIQSIGYYQQASLTYQAKSDLAGAHSWAAARTSLDTKAPAVTELTAALTSGDLKLTNNGGVYNIGVIATTGDKYCLGVKSPNVKGNNVFYSTSDDPNNVMSDIALPAFCGTATEVTTTGTTTVEAPSGTSTSSPTSTATVSPSSTATATAPTFTTVNWTTPASTTMISVNVGAGSADLSKIFAGASARFPAFLSNDGGKTWPSLAYSANPQSIKAAAMSANGQIIAIGESQGNGYGNTYLSTDGGTSWKAVTGNGEWQAISMSTDGKTIVSSDTGAYGAVWVSNDSGGTWTKTTVSHMAFSGMSGDGKVIYLAAYNAIVYSTDSGKTWKNKAAFLPSATNTSVTSIAMNADGSRLVLGTSSSKPSDGGIYISNDSGATFTHTVPYTRASGAVSWQVAMSQDGTKLVAADTYNGGEAYTSLDSGATWKGSGVTGLWKSLVVSTDGSKFVAIAQNGYVSTGSLG